MFGVMHCAQVCSKIRAFVLLFFQEVSPGGCFDGYMFTHIFYVK